MPPLSSTVKLIIWILVGVATLGSTILASVLEKNLSYFVRRRGPRPSQKPLILWILFGVSTLTVIFGAAIASSAPDLENFVSSTSSPPFPTPTSIPPGPTPIPGPVSIDWLYPKATLLSSNCIKEKDWIGFHKNSSGNNFVCDYLPFPLKQTWEIQGSGEDEFNSPIIVDHILFAVDGDGNVYSVDVDSGKVIWKSQVDWVSGTGQSLGYGSGLLYLAGYGGTVYALDTKNGKVEWSFGTDQTLTSSPLFYKDKIFVVGSSGDLFALDAGTGDSLWKREVGEVYRTDIIANEGLIYVYTRDGILHAIQADDGEESWSVQVAHGIGNGRTAAWLDSILYIAGDQKIFAIDAARGNIIWSQPWNGLFEVEALSVDDYLLYVPIPSQYAVVALDRLTGQMRWTARVNKDISANSPVVNTRYLITRANDELIFINKYNGSIEWKQTIGKNLVMPFPIGAIDRKTMVVNVENKIVAYVAGPGRVMTIGSKIGVWDPQTEPLIQIEPPLEMEDCNPGGLDSLICVGIDEDQVKVYEITISSGVADLLTSFRLDIKPKSSIVLSSNSKYVAVATGMGYLVSEYIDHGDLYILDVSNSKQTKITSEFCGSSKSLAWSPDSQWIVYPLCVGKGEFGADASSLIRIRNDGSEELGLANLDTNFPMLGWSADGLWIAYSDLTLNAITPDGTQEVKLDSNTGEVQWGSSGTLLFYNSSNAPTDQEGIYVRGGELGDGRWISTYAGRIYVDGTPYGVSLDENYIGILDFGDHDNNVVNIYDVRTSELWKVIEFGKRFDENIRTIKWIP